MKQVVLSILRFFLINFKQIAAFFPSKLPVGRTEFEAFSKSILETYDIKDEPAFRQMIAINIQHLAPTKHRVSKRHFMKLIKSAMSRETAYWMLKEIQDEHKKKTSAEASAQPPALEAEVVKETEPCSVPVSACV